MSRITRLEMFAVLALLASASTIASAQTFTRLHSFTGPDGANSQAALIQGFDGNFYGTTYNGGALFSGSVYKTTRAGAVTSLFSFESSTGDNPIGALLQAGNGTFYGTTYAGGPEFYGTVFSITPTGTETTLVSFDLANGGKPQGPMVMAPDGIIYGTSVNSGPDGSDGSMFSMTTGGTLTTLLTFDGSGRSGRNPVQGIMQATDGDFYGLDFYNGNYGYGTVYKVDHTWTEDTLYSFSNGTDGSAPQGPLVEGPNGELYGATFWGGANGLGTVFEVSRVGFFSTLHSFDNTDGANPAAGVIVGTDGNIYGTTSAGGANGDGTVFQITSSGLFTTLHNFSGGDGKTPEAPLVQGTDGSFYGTTNAGGGSANAGTIFRLSMGLAPFVKTNPTAGLAGNTVHILGNNLGGTTSVTFNGLPATFTVESGSLINATVPAGATSGVVQVTTPGGVLTSNVAFQIL